MQTDANLFTDDRNPRYTTAGLMWSALDLLLGVEEIDDEEDELSERFQTVAAELLARL